MVFDNYIKLVVLQHAGDSVQSCEELHTTLMVCLP